MRGPLLQENFYCGMGRTSVFDIRKNLPRGKSHGMIIRLETLRALSGLYFDSMKRISVRCGRLSVACVMFLLVGVVALSTAGRQPCLRVCTGRWHTYKAGHMAESEQLESAGTEAVEPAKEVVVVANATRSA